MLHGAELISEARLLFRADVGDVGDVVLNCSEREREREIYIYIWIWIPYTCISYTLHSVVSTYDAFIMLSYVAVNNTTLEHASTSCNSF